MISTDPRLKGLWLISYEDYSSRFIVSYGINQRLRIFSEYIDRSNWEIWQPEQILPWNNFLFKQVRGLT
ncbi:MAG: hypothetical protein QXH39_00620 [Conexivisphaerales archaeon]